MRSRGILRRAGQGREEPAQRLIEEQRRGSHPRRAIPTDCGERDLFPALSPEREEVRSFLLRKGGVVGIPLREEDLGPRDYLRGLQSRRGFVGHGWSTPDYFRRIATTVGCAGIGTVATVFFAARSNMSIAPGSAPIDSWLIKAYFPSGE